MGRNVDRTSSKEQKLSLVLNYLATMSPFSTLNSTHFFAGAFFLSDDGEYESRLSQSKLLQLCEYDPVMTFVKACDHLLYQTLVEILIPDVLRPIPGKKMSLTAV